MNLRFTGDVFESIREWLMGYGGAILSILPKTLYFLCTLVFQVIDILQILVRKVAGLDVVYYGNAESPETGDIALKFIQEIFTGKNSILSNIFWAFIILGLILLFITTFVAVLRSEYAATDSKSASKSKIIGKAFKAIASFAIVPIVCYFGIFLSNAILQALDSVTANGSSEIGSTYTETDENGEIIGTSSVSSSFSDFETLKGEKTYIGYHFGPNNDAQIYTTSTPLSGLIFKAAAYKANRIRSPENSSTGSDGNEFRTALEENAAVGAGVLDKFGTDYARAATFLDECFANGYTLRGEVDLPKEPFENSFLFSLGDTGGSFFSNDAPAIKTFDKNNTQKVWYFYDLWSFDFVIAIGALVITAKLLIYIVFGLMKRLFEVVVLFLVAPPIASLMPLDDGAALKKWREKFTAKVIAAYGPIVGINLFFVILPFLTQIKFFNMAFVDGIINVFFVIVGLLMVKDLISTLSELIGAEDSAKAGEGLAGEVGSSLAKIGQVAAAPAGLAVKGVKMGVKVGKFIGDKAKKGNQNRLLNKEIEKEHGAEMQLMTRRQRKAFLAEKRNEMSDEEKQEIYSRGPTQRLKNWVTSHNPIRNRQMQDMADARSGFDLYRERTGKDGRSWQKLSSRKQQEYISEATGGSDRISLREKRRELNSARIKEAVGKLNVGRLITRQRFNYNANKYSEATEDLRTATTDKGRAKARKRADKYYSGFMNVAGDHIRNAGASAHERIVREKAERDYTNSTAEAARRREAARTSGAQTFQAINQGKGILKQQLKVDTQKIGRDIAKAFGDSLSPILNTLGDKMAKGFKDSGGWSAIGSRMQGLSGKEEKLQKATKEQKLNMSAQREAQKLIGTGDSSVVRLDDDSIKKLADKITGH